MQLTYKNQTYSPPEGNITLAMYNHNAYLGVTVETIDFGGLDGVAYLDTKKQIGVWNDVIGNLTEVGYTPGLNIRAAPVNTKTFPHPHFSQV